MYKQNFINLIKDGAIAGYKKYGVLASLTIAQAILETGWGKSTIGNNIFGIKATSSWKGKVQQVKTHEYVNGEKIYIDANFRDYNSIYESLEDRFKLLSSSRYKKVIESKDYKEAAQEIYKAGYATDPNYPNKLIQIIEENKLYIYDKEVIEMKLLKRGDKGTEVKNLQIALNSLDLNDGQADGIFGSGTENSVKELQSIFGLSPDGIGGRNTWELLNELNKIKHFKLNEFRCKHCRKLKLNINLLLKLEELRIKTGPLIINSGYRCTTHNKNVGGASGSKHLKGTAADLRAVNMSPANVYNHANQIFNNGGVGKYNTFTHVDVRGSRSRWNG